MNSPKISLFKPIDKVPTTNIKKSRVFINKRQTLHSSAMLIECKATDYPKPSEIITVSI
jgi:hypothetical protein